MYTKSEFLSAVKQLRPYLPSLLSAEESSKIVDLDELLSRADREEEVLQQIEDWCRSFPIVRRWMGLALGMNFAAARYEPLAGEQMNVPVIRFGCPEPNCVFTWSIHRIGQPIPPCPVHKVNLVFRPMP